MGKMSINLSAALDLPDLSKQLRLVDEELLKTAATDKILGQSMERLIKAGGKRLRPSLVIACATLNGGKVTEKVIKLAAAVELVHLGSLVHDDIIDEADSRWNIATINQAEGINQAIVAGDYLLATGCALAAEASQTAAQLTAMTIIEMCTGQALELSDQNNLNRSQKSYFQSIGGKTAALIRLSCVLGVMAAGLSKSQQKLLQEFGNNFGLSFQLVDDLMDLVSTTELYGKPVGNDIGEGIYTLPVIIGLQKQPNLKKKLANNPVEDLFSCGAIQATIKEIQHYNNLAAEALSSFHQPRTYKLQNLPNEFLNWSIHNLTAPSYRQQLLEMQKV